MKELIKEYNKSLYKVQKAYQQTNDDGQKKIISGMIGDIQYTLDWLKTGRRPGSYKGVEAPYRIVFEIHKLLNDPIMRDSIKMLLGK